MISTGWTVSESGVLDGCQENYEDDEPIPNVQCARLGTGRVFPIGTFNGLGKLMITGVLEGGADSNELRAVELYVLEDIPHLSSYGLGRAGVQESSFNPDSSAAAGQWIYFVSNTSDFVSFVGAVPGPAGYYEIRPAFFDFSGEEAFQLFQSGIVEDTFGVVGTSSFLQPWYYRNSWASRLSGSGPSGAAFHVSEWQFGTPGVLTGETTNPPLPDGFPVGSFTPPTRRR
jgi:hypothetical protein